MVGNGDDRRGPKAGGPGGRLSGERRSGEVQEGVLTVKTVAVRRVCYLRRRLLFLGTHRREERHGGMAWRGYARDPWLVQRRRQRTASPSRLSFTATRPDPRFSDAWCSTRPPFCGGGKLVSQSTASAARSKLAQRTFEGSRRSACSGVKRRRVSTASLNSSAPADLPAIGASIPSIKLRAVRRRSLSHAADSSRFFCCCCLLLLLLPVCPSGGGPYGGAGVGR